MADKDFDEVKAEYDPSKRQRELRLKKYRAQVAAAMSWRRDNFETTWRNMIDLYKNKSAFSDDDDMPDNISLAIGFSTINVIYPSVSLNRPKVTLTAQRPDMVGPAEIAEAVVNYWWKHHDYQEEFRRAVKDFLIIGHGWVKTTWLLKETERESTEDEYRDDVAMALSEKYEYLAARPDDAHLFPEDHEIVATIPTIKKIVVEDHPKVERISPFDMVVDPDADSPQSLRWIAQRIAVPKAEARLKKDWNQKVLKDLINTAGTLKEGDGYYEDQVDPEETFIIVYEHYDLTTGYLCTFAESGDDFLKDPEPIPFPFEHPFVYVNNYEVPEQFYGIGELEMIEPLIEAESMILTRQLGDVKQFTRKYATKERWVTDKAILAMKSTADGEIVYASEEAPDDLRQVFVALPTMTPDPSMYQMSEVLQDNTTRVSAISEYQQGVQPEIRRTATEAGIIADASNARASEKLAQIEMAIAKLARRIIQLGQTFLTTKQVAQIYQEDPTTPTEWREFTREEIRGEFAFDVEGGSTQPRNETFRRQSALQMMDAFSNPLFQPQPTPDGQIAPILDARRLAAYVLTEGFGVKNASQFIIPEPPPMPTPEEIAMQAGQGGVPGEQPALPPGEMQVPPPEGGMAFPTS